MNTEKTGSFIAELRKEKGLTQAQLAEQLHVSDKAVSRWETGRGFPDIGSLEDLSEKLEVSVAELLKGERITEPLPAEEARELADSSLRLVRELFSRQRIQNLILTFLAATAVMIVLLVHLNSPRYIPAGEEPAALSVLENGQIVAVLKEGVSGCDVETIRTEDGKEIVSFGCYDSWMERLHKKGPQIVLLGEKGKTSEIWLYPGSGQEGDRLLYSENGSPSGGMVTLPRLVYNFWTLIGVLAAAVLGTAGWLLRKKHYGPLLLKVALLPLCFSLSAFLLLAGSSASVYDAAYYFSGILLLGFLLYALALVLLRKRNRRKITV